MTHPSYEAILPVLEALFNENKPGGTAQFMSVNENNSKTQSIIKVVTPIWWINKPESNAIKTSPSFLGWFNKHNHNQVLTIVNDIAWTG